MRNLPINSRRTGKLSSLTAWGIAFVAASIFTLTSLIDPFTRESQLARAGLLEKPATGDLVIIEIDAKSLEALDRWPWPRHFHADLITILSRVGVEQIAFDVDFSVASDAAEDRLLSAALAGSGVPVILPTFRQLRTSAGTDYAENLPLPVFRENALLASVNVHPDEHGQLNDYSFGTITGSTVRPSLGSMIAGSAGAINQRFRIDQSIAPATIPRFSFVDVLQGKVAPSLLRGKKILVGATAIEIGDRYATGRHGIVPGVVVQALAAETLLQSGNLPNIGAWPCLLVVVAIILVMVWRARPSWQCAMVGGASMVTLYAALLLAEHLSLLTWDNESALAFLVLFFAIDKLFQAGADLHTSRFYNLLSNLPNEAMLVRQMSESPGCTIAIAKIADFGDFVAVTDGHTRAALFDRIAARLKFLAVNAHIYHLDSDTLGWIIRDGHSDDLDGHFRTAAALLRPSFDADGKSIQVSAAFGVSDNSLDDAKIAARLAESAGSPWQAYSIEAAKTVKLRQHILVDMEQAIADGDIFTMYQAKMSLKTKQIVGAEALVRWTHPVHGSVGPAIFVPILEKADRIDTLTLHVLQTAVDDFSRWARQGITIGVAVNLSAKLLNNPPFIESAIAVIESAEIPNDKITFEVTETAALNDIELSINALNKIRTAGIKISIDDYGTGQSTLSYLQRLPVDEIKLDQSFIRTMAIDDVNRLMVSSTIELAHALNMTIVAEGIEDDRTFELLAAFNCDVGQGWQISKPMVADVFEENWLYLDAEARQRA